MIEAGEHRSAAVEHLRRLSADFYNDGDGGEIGLGLRSGFVARGGSDAGAVENDDLARTGRVRGAEKLVGSIEDRRGAAAGAIEREGAEGALDDGDGGSGAGGRMPAICYGVT
ncbi:MAG: hypothetical protein NTV52_06985 [Acidobacteria bacterium]|nr:hypothetical protein [Acidobacteriota bacterium]